MGWKDKIISWKDSTLESIASKVGNSKLVLREQSELLALVEKSKTKTITTKEGEEKTYLKRSLLLIGDGEKDFFRNFALSFPLLLTKTFAQSTPLKMHDIHTITIDVSRYGISLQELPLLVVFENETVYKSIFWEENIKKVVSSFNLDLNKGIEDAPWVLGKALPPQKPTPKETEELHQTLGVPPSENTSQEATDNTAPTDAQKSTKENISPSETKETGADTQKNNKEPASTPDIAPVWTTSKPKKSAPISKEENAKKESSKTVSPKKSPSKKAST